MSKKKIDAIAFNPELAQKHAKNSFFQALKVKKAIDKPITKVVVEEEITEEIMEETTEEPQQLVAPFGPYREPLAKFDIDVNEDEETEEELLDETNKVTEPSSTHQVLFPNLKPATFSSLGPYREQAQAECNIDEDKETKEELLNKTNEVTEPSSTHQALFPNLKPATFVIVKPATFEEVSPAKSSWALEKKRRLEHRQ